MDKTTKLIAAVTGLLVAAGGETETEAEGEEGTTTAAAGKSGC